MGGRRRDSSVEMLSLVRRICGDPGLIRTADTQFRKLLLYPSELRGHFKRNELQALKK